MELCSVNDMYVILSQLFSYQERKVEEDQPTLDCLQQCFLVRAVAKVY